MKYYKYKIYHTRISYASLHIIWETPITKIDLKFCTCQGYFLMIFLYSWSMNYFGPVEFTRLGPLLNVQPQLLCIQLCPYIISHRNRPVKDTVDWRTVKSYASANISVKCIDWQWRLQTMQLCCVCISLVYTFVAYFKSTDNHLYINLSMQLYHHIS